MYLQCYGNCYRKLSTLCLFRDTVWNTAHWNSTPISVAENDSSLSAVLPYVGLSTTLSPWVQWPELSLVVAVGIDILSLQVLPINNFFASIYFQQFSAWGTMAWRFLHPWKFCYYDNIILESPTAVANISTPKEGVCIRRAAIWPPWKQ